MVKGEVLHSLSGWASVPLGNMEIEEGTEVYVIPTDKVKVERVIPYESFPGAKGMWIEIPPELDAELNGKSMRVLVVEE